MPPCYCPRSARSASVNSSEGPVQNYICQQKYDPWQQRNETHQNPINIYCQKVTAWLCSQVCVRGRNVNNSTMKGLVPLIFQRMWRPEKLLSGNDTAYFSDHFTTEHFLPPLHMRWVGRTNEAWIVPKLCRYQHHRDLKVRKIWKIRSPGGKKSAIGPADTTMGPRSTKDSFVALS